MLPTSSPRLRRRPRPRPRCASAALTRTLTCAAALAAVLLQGCGGADPADYALRHDLAAELPVAEVQRETGRLEVGRREADPWLVSGFSGAEASGRRWSLGRRSEVRFFLAAPRELSVAFRAAPFDGPGLEPQRLGLKVNGRPVGEVTMQPVPREYAVRVPADALRAGENRLVLHAFRATVPAEVSAGANPDPRPLAVSWEWIAFGDGVEPAPPRAAGGDLYLPFGTRVDYYLRLPPGAALLADGLALRGASGGHLEVTAEEDGAAPRRVGRWQADARPRVLPLLGRRGTGSGETWVRLSLAAVPNDDPQAASGLVLSAPAVGEPKAASEGAASRRPDEGPEAGTGVQEADVVAERSPAGRGRRPNLLVYLVDALRADRLGVYGYPRPTSPRLDAFATESTVFTDAVAQSPWTRPSVTTLFTGLTPQAHGVVGRVDSLSPEALTLAEVLHAEGYATAAAVTNPNVAGRFGLRQGFETYDLLSRTRSRHVTEWAEAWLEGWRRHGDERPFFLYLHTVDPHAPYAPEPAWRRLLAPDVPQRFVGSLWLLKRLKSGEEPSTGERVRRLSALYDAEVAANDAAFGALLDVLDARGLADDTVVVFVSDHGEEFHEHGGWEHAETLYSELLHVPLVIRLPAADDRAAGRRVETPVQQADLMPTLLRLAGAPVPPALEGRDLGPLLAAGSRLADDGPLFSHLDRLGVAGAAVTVGPWRCIDMLSRRGAAGPSRELYRRPEDPGEHHDLTAERPVVAGWCRQLLRAHAAAAASRALVPGVEEVDPELAEKLRALGYL